MLLSLIPPHPHPIKPLPRTNLRPGRYIDELRKKGYDAVTTKLLWLKYTDTGHKFAPAYVPLSTAAMAKLLAEMRDVYQAAAAEQVRWVPFSIMCCAKASQEYWFSTDRFVRTRQASAQALLYCLLASLTSVLLTCLRACRP